MVAWALALTALLPSCGHAPDVDASLDTAASATPPPGMALVVIGVRWPSLTRELPFLTTRVRVVVTGPGIATPIEGEVAQPASSLVLYVPPGTARLFSATALDDSGNSLLTAKAENVKITAGVENRVRLTFVLVKGDAALAIDYWPEPLSSSAAASMDWQDLASGSLALTGDWVSRPLSDVSLTGDWVDLSSGSAGISADWQDTSGGSAGLSADWRDSRRSSVGLSVDWSE